MGYRQLTQGQRYQIKSGLQHQCRLRTIAEKIQRSSSTVSREIRRNSIECTYCPDQAQQPSGRRHLVKRAGQGHIPNRVGIEHRPDRIISSSLIHAIG
ncbi:helix-turn-helix domain-containing protein [Vreelandella utahensis]|uniref:helix-turn-helix domain-containing protein n=1 Tax=Vreelandella halophila TaxID=86177 RepID=UPI000985C6AA